MKKLVCVFGMIALLSFGASTEASAQFGNYPQKQVSARAKGAIIGGGLGAAAGAIIHKRDPVAGGVVGAVVGAGAGYVIGNNEDKIRERKSRQYYRSKYHKNRGYYEQRRVYSNRYGY